MRLLPLLVLAALICACASPQVPLPPSPRAVTMPLSPPSLALVPIERCGETEEGFDDWMASFCEHAIADGISRDLVGRALGNVVYDRSVIELDRSQRPHKLSLEDFSSSHVTPARVRRGKK